MVNRYGQTDLTQALLAQGTSPSPYKTPLGQAGRLMGIALAERGKRKKADENRSALADALAGMNSGSLTGEGPTTDAAGRASIGDPQLMARLFSSGDPSSMAVAQALFNRSMQPAPERKVDQAADGYKYYRDTGERVYPNAVKQADPYNLSPGQQRFDGNNNLIASVPSTPKELSPREKAFANLTPEQQVQHFLKPNTEVKLGGQQTAEDKKYGELLVSRFGSIQEDADNAANQLSVIQQARAINESALPNQLTLAAGNVMQSIGINPDDILGGNLITNGQQFNGIMEQAVLQAMSTQKGPQTDRDQERIKSTVASLRNTPEARAFLLDSAEAMNRMKMLKAEFWQRHKDESGSFNGAAKKWADTFGGAGLVRKWKSKDGHSGIFFFPQWYAEARNHPANAELSDAEILELWKSYE